MAASNSSVVGPLAGIRVLDLATERAEQTGRLLSDLGAEVIKIEPPAGANTRKLPPFVAGHEGEPESSLYWAAVGLGKRSVILDLRTAAGADALRRMVATADVLVESFDPGTMARLGLSYERLSVLNPALIFVSVTPYGQTGPHALRPATELTLEAAGGLVGLQGDGDRAPVPVGYPQAAFHAGAQAAADAIIALNERADSGLGQHLDVSVQAAVVWTLMHATGFPPNTGGDPPNTGEQRTNPPMEAAPGVAFGNVWRCKDGYVQATFTMGGLGARTLGNLIQLIEAEGQLLPEHSANGWSEWTKVIAPAAIPREILGPARDEIGRYFLTKTKEELMRRAVKHKMLIAPVRTIDELLRDPQLAARDYWEVVGGKTHPGIAARLSRTPWQLHGPAPKLGQDQALIDEVRPAAERHLPAARERRSRAFDGLKVADFAWVGVGPIIAKALADHGATVVHVESSGRPDALRQGPPFKDGIAGLDRSQFQANFNSSKLGLAANLALPEGRALAERLVAWADVVLESFVPGVLKGLGLDYAHLSEGRDDLIMLSTCLAGQTGPYATYRGFGTQGAALAGLHGVTGWPDRPPKGTWGAYTDFIAPRYGISALTAAIYERRSSGKGQYIDLSQAEAAIHFLEPAILDYTVNGRILERSGHGSDRACPHGVYAVAGTQRYVAVACESDEQWRALCRTAPLAEFAGLEGLATRLPHDEAIDAALAAWCAPQDPWELVERLTGAGVPAAVVQRPSDLYNDPQLTHREFFVTCEHVVMGPTPYDGPVTRFSATPPQLTAGPVIGQHNDEVLTELLGLSDEEIAELAVAGVFS